ncbi:hypothetical protein [Rossellomorea aquimaris]|uniref:hypothetical protein n=1 Tax=Rossellomorea aquimaris TaxID=189382 RepID=UPI0014962286|nr:hypothetical protein [Rossellomorea aquimaris]
MDKGSSEYSFTPALIVVEDEDSYQKSGRALKRGVWHKTNRPGKRSFAFSVGLAYDMCL